VEALFVWASSISLCLDKTIFLRPPKVKQIHQVEFVLGNFSKSPGTLWSYGNKPTGKGNRASKASNAFNGWLVRFLYEMTGCRSETVLLALRSKW